MKNHFIEYLKSAINKAEWTFINMDSKVISLIIIIIAHIIGAYIGWILYSMVH